MRKITIKNSKTGEVTHGATFETLLDAEKWKNNQIEKGSWGKPQRWQTDLPSNPVLESDKESSLDSREYTDSFGDTYIQYLLPCEYIIEEENYQLPYYQSRSEEYQKIDHLLKEALVEKALGDNSKWNEYVSLRNSIKVKYPKPE